MIDKTFKICIWFIVIVVLLSKCFKKKYKYTIKNKDIDITLVVGNIFKEKGAKIIPTNTTFDTKTEGEFISEKSIQGQFQKKYYKNNLEDFNNLIASKLKGIPIEKVLIRKKSKNKQYAIGTTIKVEQEGERFYFLAIADVNEYGKPNSNFENLKLSFAKAWEFISEQGHMEPIVMPVLGTGRTGVNVSRQDVIKEIIFSFVATTRENKISDELKICIHPKDIKNIDFIELQEYLEYLCKFYYANDNKKFYGKEEKTQEIIATFG